MAELLVDHSNFPFRAAVVMHFVSMQLLNAFEWFRILQRSRLLEPGQWKGFVHFKRSAHEVMAHTDFIMKVAYDEGLHKLYAPGQGNTGAAASGGGSGGSAAPGPAVAPAPARGDIAGPMTPQYRGRDMPARRHYYETSTKDVEAAMAEFRNIGWKVQYFFRGSRNANIVR
jgi:hypothetical protein